MRALALGAFLLLMACGGDAPDDDAAVPAAPPAAAPVSQPTVQDPTTEVQQALSHEDPSRRQAAAWELTEREDIPAPDRAQLLLGAIETEISQPTPGATDGSYLTASEWSSYVYTRALGALAPQALETVRAAAESESGELGARAVLALAYAGERDVIPQLQELLRTSTVTDVRSDAAFLLGELDAREAIPDLQEAVLDTSLIMVQGLGGGPAREFYPVRESALRSLERLGFTIERTADGGFRVVRG